MKILLFGWYYSTNYGDAVICECLAAKLREQYPDADVTIADMNGRTAFPDESGEEREASGASGLSAAYRKLKRRRLKKILMGTVGCLPGVDYAGRTYIRGFERRESDIREICAQPADLVIFAGGQLFMDSLTPQAVFCINSYADRGVPIIVNAGGGGPVYSRKLRALYHHALMRPEVRWISCRDRTKWVEEHYLNGEKMVDLVSDPALWAADLEKMMETGGSEPAKKNAPDFSEEHVNPTNGLYNKNNPSSHASDDGTIGLGVMFADSLPVRKCIRFWINLIRYLDQHEIRWKIFTNGNVADEIFAAEILSRMPEYNGADNSESSDGRKSRPYKKLICVPRSPQELVSVIQGFRGVVSFRLHSSIIACSCGVPAVGVIWDNKLNSFYEMIGHPERCLSLSVEPSVVWERYCQAEKEGYPVEKIRKLRGESLEALCRAIV